MMADFWSISGLVGSVASVAGWWQSWRQAKRSREAANDATAAKRAIEEHLKVARFSELVAELRQAATIVRRYTSSIDETTRRGRNLSADVAEVRAIVGKIRSSGEELPQPTTRHFLKEIESLLEDFALASGKALLTRGNAVLVALESYQGALNTSVRTSVLR